MGTQTAICFSMQRCASAILLLALRMTTSGCALGEPALKCVCSAKLHSSRRVAILIP